MTEPATTPTEQREQLIRTAIDLIDSHPTGVWGAEAIIRTLEARGMLTSREQHEEDIKQAISAHRVFNVVPTARFKAEQVRAGKYIAALERTVFHLLAGVDAVSGLAGIVKTAKGQRLLAQAQVARTFSDEAREAHLSSETRDSDYA